MAIRQIFTPEEAIAINRLTRPPNGVRVKSIALPAEHGGWGFLFEPIALGLLVAPSVAGFYLALSAVGFFLARHPLTLVMLNRRRSSPRNALAKRFAFLYVAVGSAFFSGAVIFSEHSFALPLLIAAPLAIVQLTYDWTGQRRVLLAEIAGACAISSLATAVALSGGWSAAAAFALWVIVMARAVPAILYVRACLARMHRRPASGLAVLIAHAVAVMSVGVLVRVGLAPRLAVGAMIVLFVRAAFAGSRSAVITPKQLGFREIGFGAVTVFAVFIGYVMGI